MVIRALVLAGLLLSLTPIPANAVEPGDTLFFSDFDTLDDWHVDAGCVQAYSGVLRMCLRQLADGSLEEGRIDTEGLWSFTYGQADVRMRFLAPLGAHSAAWLQTTEGYIIGQSEIDFAESFGRNVVWNNVYWRELDTEPGQYLGVREPTPIDVSDWHRYTVQWTPYAYRFKIDGDLVSVITEGLSDRPKMLILSQLVSGWEEPNTQLDQLWVYDTEVDWFRVRANAYT